MTLTKVLITVKTYPTLSVKYDELVCTAGFLEDGSWIRIYPIPFRKKSFEEQYEKYDWIETDLVKNEKDFRKETFRPVSYDTKIKVLNHLGTDPYWSLRKEIVLKKGYYASMDKLILEAKNKEIMTSLAVFKPTEIIDFVIEPVDREWDRNKLEKIKQLRSSNLFANEKEDLFEVVKKLPYKFYYVMLDCVGRKSKMMIEDWEIGQLYWNCLHRHNGDENKALEDVKNKYFDDFTKTKDLYLFLGTTKKHHSTSKNPFMIIGVFYPPIIQSTSNQLTLF